MTFRLKTWDSEQYRPELYYQELEKFVSVLKATLTSADVESIISKYFDGIYLRDTVNRQLAWLPSCPVNIRKASDALLSKLEFMCNISPKTFAEYDTDKIPINDRHLPHPASINAKILLMSLKNGLTCPEGDPGMVINHILRNSLYEIIEMAVKTKKTYKIEENGFIKTYLNINDTNTVLHPRDICESLSFYKNTGFYEPLPRELQASKAMCTFFNKMRVLTYKINEEKRTSE